MNLVHFEKRGAIAEIRLNRPDKLNAINGEMLDGLDEALARAEGDDDVRVVMLTGSGRAFSAGFDLDMGEPPEGLGRNEYIRRELRRDFDLIMRFWDCPKPVVAAVQGYCLGSSLELSAVCDITIAAEGCLFGVPEVRFGSGIVCLILPWITGLKNAGELLLAGNRIDAQRALSMGLVNEVVPDDDLIRRATAVAAEMTLNDPLAVRLTKRALRRSFDVAGLREALDQALELDIEVETTDTPESLAFNRILDEEGPKAALAWRAAHLPGVKEG